VTGNLVRGRVEVEANAGAVSVTGNTIRGTLRADDNTGGVEIADNRIGNNLQCEGNDPAPTGGGNLVRGDKQDQCETL
jgi:putative cofactor-binding repeat protein